MTNSSHRQPRRASLGVYEPPGPNKKTNQKKNMRRKYKASFIAACIVVVVCIGCIGTYSYVFSPLQTEPFNHTKEQLGVCSPPRRGVTNIALFGIDSWEDDRGRSDAVMILSIDGKNNSIKLSSILRDSYVKIEGHGKDKLTHAYAYGGAALAVKTLNQNFGLDIKDYIVMNFQHLVQMIDAVGGLTLEVSEKEKNEINRIVYEMDASGTPLEQTGTVHLTGLQATAYARIRKIDSDNKRAERQREVLQTLVDTCKSKGVLQYPKLLRTIFSYMNTSLSAADFARLGLSVVGSNMSLQQYAVPSDLDSVKEGMYNGAWVWRYDTEKAGKRLVDFIYNS